LMYVLVLMAIVNSTIANANAGANVFTRTAFAFGRVGAFPKWMGKLDPKHKSPKNALMVQLIVGLVLGLGLGFKYTPQVAFGVVATGLVVVVVLVYMVVNIACIGYYSKHRREDRHPIIHIVVPIIGFLFLVPGFMNAAGITGIPGLSFIVSLSAPLSYAAYAMAIWMAIGVITLFILKKRNPQAIAEVATIHID
jgi:amino acid transporter